MAENNDWMLDTQQAQIQCLMLQYNRFVLMKDFEKAKSQWVLDDCKAKD